MTKASQIPLADITGDDHIPFLSSTDLRGGERKIKKVPAISILPETRIMVNSVSDLPEPTDTGDGLGVAHHLAAGVSYYLGNTIYLAYPIVPSTGTTTIEGHLGVLAIYLGSGGMVRNNATSPMGQFAVSRVKFVSGTGTNNLFDITAGSAMTIEVVDVANFASMGSISNITNFIVFDGMSIIDIAGGITFTDVTIIYYRRVGLTYSVPISGAWININGTFLSAAFADCNFIPIAGDSVWNINPTIVGFVAINDVNPVALYGGIPFHASSIDQTDPRVEASGTRNIPDSATIGSFNYEFGTESTSIVTGNLIGDGTITAYADGGGGTSTTISTDNTTNMTNGNMVNILYDDDYRGMYTISNIVAGVSFDIDATYVAKTPPANAKWESGWTKITATTVAGENERAAMTGDNQITFANLEAIKQLIHTEYAVRQTGGGTISLQLSVFKNNARIEGYVSQREVGSSLSEGTIQPSTSLVSGDILEAYIRAGIARDIEFSKLNLTTR